MACCKKCNQCKTNKTLEECGLTLLSVTGTSLGHHVDITPQKSEDISQKAEDKEEKKARSRRLTDDEFLDELRKSPAYMHVNFTVEFAKMDVWLLGKPGRQKTRKFILNWLNKIEAPMSNGKTGQRPPPPPPKNDPIGRGLWGRTYGKPQDHGYE